MNTFFHKCVKSLNFIMMAFTVIPISLYQFIFSANLICSLFPDLRNKSIIRLDTCICIIYKVFCDAWPCLSVVVFVVLLFDVCIGGL